MKTSLSIVTIFFFIFSITAQDDLKTQSISIFKNGQSFVIKKGNIKTKNKVFNLHKMPNALFGTLWFSTPKDDITQVISKNEKFETSLKREANTLIDLLYANLHNKITIETTDGKTVTGFFEKFDLKTPNPTLLLKTDNKWMSLQFHEIKTVAFNEKPVQFIETKTDSISPIIKINFKDSGTKPLEMMYLQTGINWVPTYLLELESDSKATLKLQAEVMNYLEDIKNIDLNFVIGVPNFSFATRPATLVDLPRILQTPSTSQYGRNLGLVTQSPSFSNSITYSTSEVAKSISPRDLGFNMSSPEVNNELYFYKLKQVNLEKGGRAHFPVFSADVKIKHLYETVLPNSNLNNHQHRNKEYSFDEKVSDVFHTIEITNTTKYPFTHGAVMVINKKDRKPLSQSGIKYTPSGLKGYLKITKAPDISVKEKENLVAIDLENTKRYRSNNYKLITIESKIMVTNTKRKKINFVLRKTIEGEVIASNTKYEKNTKVLANNVNDSENICYEIDLKPGEVKTLIYTYNAYVRK